eukprot:1158903-Pelagomonas_calceolata.AAC.22
MQAGFKYGNGAAHYSQLAKGGTQSGNTASTHPLSAAVQQLGSWCQFLYTLCLVYVMGNATAHTHTHRLLQSHILKHNSPVLLLIWVAGSVGNIPEQRVACGAPLVFLGCMRLGDKGERGTCKSGKESSKTNVGACGLPLIFFRCMCLGDERREAHASQESSKINVVAAKPTNAPAVCHLSSLDACVWEVRGGRHMQVRQGKQQDHSSDASVWETRGGRHMQAGKESSKTNVVEQIMSTTWAATSTKREQSVIFYLLYAAVRGCRKHEAASTA